MNLFLQITYFTIFFLFFFFNQTQFLLIKSIFYQIWQKWRRWRLFFSAARNETGFFKIRFGNLFNSISKQSGGQWAIEVGWRHEEDRTGLWHWTTVNLHLVFFKDFLANPYQSENLILCRSTDTDDFCFNFWPLWSCQDWLCHSSVY